MNSTALLAFTARTAAAGAALWPAVVRIAGVEYVATVPEPRILTGLISGTETGEGTLVARIAVAILADKPALNQELLWKRPADATWDTRAWWIDSAQRSPIDSEWVITCSLKN